jgi:predicted transcriptional regulator of viral defense system
VVAFDTYEFTIYVFKGYFAQVSAMLYCQDYRAASQRMGYLIEALEFQTEKAIGVLQKSMSSRYTPPDILSEPKGRYIGRWKIILNLPENELSQWMDQR